MTKVILKKENGQTQLMNYTELKEKKDRGICHMCANDCANARANMCSKIADIDKKSIDQYDFITDGYQIYDDVDGLDTFVVSKCDNYAKETYRKKDMQEVERLNSLKESIRVLFFDTETVEEAYITQNDLLKRGLLAGARGKKPSEREIAKIKKKIR